MKTLQAFTQEEFVLAHQLLASKVSTMLGRKMEEADWGYVYNNSKKIPPTGWSNLKIDVMFNGLGVEHKMMRYGRAGSIKEICGTRPMHPSATRSIRVKDGDPNAVAADVLKQYGDLINGRRKEVQATSKNGDADMRFGWLIWKEYLDEFLYFEEEMLVPNPDNYYAEWNVIDARGSRKAAKNLWIYDRESKQKVYSVTTVAGAKIQPYFEIPPPDDPNLYYFKVQGNEIGNNIIEVWVTRTTAKILESIIGGLEIDRLSAAILEAQLEDHVKSGDVVYAKPSDLSVSVNLTKEAYMKLRTSFEYISDEYVFQQFALNLKEL